MAAQAVPAQPGSSPGEIHSLTIAARRDAGCGTIGCVFTLFIHGAGRAGKEAWPVQAALRQSGWVFLARHADGDESWRDAERLISASGAEGGQIVAASYGALAALLAAQQRPELVRRIVLFEPACFALARGRTAVEAHVAAMTPVFAVADDPSVDAVEFSQRFATAMGTATPDLPAHQLEAHVARLRATAPPWEVPIDEATVGATPITVVTGGWSELYEQVAEQLVALGANHRALVGHAHRPQDHPDANSVISEAP
jgi:pimeloyl-ACP methyl ester carboxylesterase